jgi:hypothetical protein
MKTWMEAGALPRRAPEPVKSGANGSEGGGADAARRLQERFFDANDPRDLGRILRACIEALLSSGRFQ